MKINKIALLIILFTTLVSITFNKRTLNKWLKQDNSLNLLPKINPPTPLPMENNISILPPIMRNLAAQIAKRIPTYKNIFKPKTNDLPEKIPNGGNFAFSCKEIKLNTLTLSKVGLG